MTDDDAMAKVAQQRVLAIDLPDLTGLTYRQVDYWIRVGYINCENAGLGSGNGSRWVTPEEAQFVAIMASLVKKFTIEPKYAVRLARVIQQNGLVKVGSYVIAKVDAA